jgi:hypothetical protein
LRSIYYIELEIGLVLESLEEELVFSLGKCSYISELSIYTQADAYA